MKPATVLVAVVVVLAVVLAGSVLVTSPESGGGRTSLGVDASLGGPAVAAEEEPQPRLESTLAQLAAASDAGGPPAVAQAAGRMALPLHDGQVRVIVEATEGRATAAANAVEPLGGRVEKVRGGLVQALVPVAALGALASDGGVQLVRLPYPRLPLVTGEGVDLIKADDWHAAGFTGSGVKVAILDLGFQGYAGLLGTELPGSVVTHSCRADEDITGEGEKHGTGVAEVVHEVAPDAELYLVNFDTDVEFAECVDWIVAQGVDVINHSVGWFGGGPGDGTGSISDTAASAVSAGVFWANAAGNQAQRHWSGPWQDGDGDDQLDFSGSDEGNDISVWSGQTVVAILKWDDPFGGSCNDYNLYLKWAGGTAASSTNLQSCSQDPVEIIVYDASISDTYWLSVESASADGMASFHLYTFRHALQYQVAAGSLVEPADNPSVLAVGAVRWNSPDTIEYFSSQGPTDDSRIKPDLVGPDGVGNSTYGSFSGTSASSPHAAGAAALVLQAEPGWTPAEVASFLVGAAVDLGAAGADTVYGAGRLDLCVDRDGDSSCTDPENDPDDDGCTSAQEANLGSVFDPADGWYDVYDVPVPARADPQPNGARNRLVDIGDVLAVIFYAFADEGGPPNANNVSYDSTKGLVSPHDEILKMGLMYDRSAGADPDPVTGIDPAGPPDGAIDVGDVLAAVAQFGLDCSGGP